jgi:hypothetical protein
VGIVPDEEDHDVPDGLKSNNFFCAASHMNNLDFGGAQDFQILSHSVTQE